MIVEIGLCATAGFLFLRGIYHSGVLSGWIIQGLRMTSFDRPIPAPRAAPPSPEIVPLWTAADEKREREMFLAAPLAWWLDPNRWGDQPGWRDDMLRAEPYCGCGQGMIHKVSGHDEAIVKRDTLIAATCPLCPVCGPNGQVAVLNTAGDEVTMWDCMKCGAEFIRSGKPLDRLGRETKKSRLRREHLALNARLQAGVTSYADAVLEEALMRPPGMVVHQPQMTYRAVMPDEGRLCLPCGCAWETPVYDHGGKGWRYVRCQGCQKWWEPPSNSPSGRLLAQGEKVHPRSETGMIPRPNCPECRRSHPALHVPIDGSRLFFRCKGCQNEWKAPLDMHDAYHHTGVKRPPRSTK